MVASLPFRLSTDFLFLSACAIATVAMLDSAITPFTLRFVVLSADCVRGLPQRARAARPAAAWAHQGGQAQRGGGELRERQHAHGPRPAGRGRALEQVAHRLDAAHAGRQGAAGEKCRGAVHAIGSQRRVRARHTWAADSDTPAPAAGCATRSRAAAWGASQSCSAIAGRSVARRASSAAWRRAATAETADRPFARPARVLAGTHVAGSKRSRPMAAVEVASGLGASERGPSSRARVSASKPERQDNDMRDGDREAQACIATRTEAAGTGGRRGAAQYSSV